MNSQQYAEADYRVGFPKRPPNFSAIKARAVAWKGAKLSKDRLIRAVAFGTPVMTLQERQFVMTLISFLSTEQIESGDTFVWAKNHTLAVLMGVNESTVTRLKNRVEHHGLVIRNMTHANRPDFGRGLDLRPLLGRLAELEAVAVRTFDECRRRNELLAESAVFDQAELPARVGNSADLIQSKANWPENTVQREPHGSLEADASRSDFLRLAASPLAPTPNHAETPPASPSDTDNCSPTRAGGFDSALPAPSIAGGKARAALILAHSLCPRLHRYIDRAQLDTLSQDELIRLGGEAVAELLPDRETSHTWQWAVTNHGWRALVMLVVALEDSSVRDPYRYFGALAVASVSPDLRPNLYRIRAERAAAGKSQPPKTIAPPEGADDPTWRAIKAALVEAGRLKAAAVSSWIDPLDYHGISGGRLSLSTRNGFLAEYVRNNHAADLRRAAHSAGVDIEDVEILHRPTN